MTQGTGLKMPCLEASFCGFHHTVDSALRILSELGVSASRVTLLMAGAGLPTRWIVAQDPPPGSVLGPDAYVKLSVAGFGYFHALPVGMWDKGGDDGPGTQEILELLDDPLQKATHWVREGALHFDIKRDNLMACSRWISLFGLNPDEWPVETWYNLSLLLPNLQQLAATEHGVKLALQLLLELPVHEVRFFSDFRLLPEMEYSRLGARFSQLGVDCVVGNRVEDLAGVQVAVGPVSLETYNAYQHEARIGLFNRVLDLCMSSQRKNCISWWVLDQRLAPRLGFEKQNARLGINSHLGRLTVVA